MTTVALPYINKLSANYTKKVSFINNSCKANNQYLRKVGVGIDNHQVSYDLKYIGLTGVELLAVETLFSVQYLGDLLSLQTPLDSSIEYYQKPVSWTKDSYFKWLNGTSTKVTDVSFSLVLGNALTNVVTTNQPIPSLLLHLNSLPPTDSITPTITTSIPYENLAVSSSSTLMPDNLAIVPTTQPSGTYHLAINLDTTVLDLTQVTVRLRFHTSTINAYLDFINGWFSLVGGFFCFGSSQVPTTTAIVLNHNYAASIEYLSGTMYLYIDGVLIGSAIVSPISYTQFFINGFSGGYNASAAMQEFTEFAVFYGTCLAAPAASYTVETSRYIP